MQTVLSTMSSCPLNGPVSCHNSTIQDTCCFNSPGGLLLQTQFFDINPPTGPVDSWTLHGLWPDNCDGSYEANCDAGRAFGNISEILSSTASGRETLDFMKVYWKDYQGDDESFWQHEWSKHGTCISTLDPACFGDSRTRATDGVEPYFTQARRLFESLPTYDWLADAGILPSHTQTYPKSSILAALKAKTGFEPYLGCQSGVLNEVWYFFNSKGSLVDGQFQQTSVVGKRGNCGTTVRYLPKSSGSEDPSPTTTSHLQPLPTGPVSGRGTLQVKQGGCLISAGTWYTSGTCATFQATPVKKDGKQTTLTFTMSSSKGPCGIDRDSDAFVCSASTPPGHEFELLVDGSLGRRGYSTDKTISRNQQGTVYEGTDRAVLLQIYWQSL